MAAVAGDDRSSWRVRRGGRRLVLHHGNGVPQELPSEYVIEYVPIDPAPSITLTNLRTMIAWVDGGDGIASYEDCVLSVISYKQFFRDWEAFYQRTWKTQQAESQVASGAGERTTVHTYGNSRDPGYSEVWLTGPDMDLFRAEIVDDEHRPFQRLYRHHHDGTAPACRSVQYHQP